MGSGVGGSETRSHPVYTKHRTAGAIPEASSPLGQGCSPSCGVSVCNSPFFSLLWFSRIQHLGAEIHLIRDMMEPIHTGGLHDFLLTALEVRDQTGSPRTCLPAPNTVVERTQSSAVCVSMGGVSGAVLRADGPHSPSGCSPEQLAEGGRASVESG